MRKRVCFVLVAALLAGCKKPVLTPPPPPPAPAPAPETKPQSVVVLLPEADGKPTAITVTNKGGTQSLTQPYQAVKVQDAATAPAAPYAMDPAEAKRLFGALTDALPAPEVSFLLYFDTGDTLNAASRAQLPLILKTISDRHSTAITVIGHTDTTGNAQANYQLGLRRAEAVAAVIRAQGAAASDVFVESHGEADQLVKTARGVAEAKNRRVEVIVR